MAINFFLFFPIGKPHCLVILKFINQFFEDNPLSCCSEEISKCKKIINEDEGDKLKLSQKNSSITVNVIKNKYYVKAKVIVPHDYPEKQVK